MPGLTRIGSRSRFCLGGRKLSTLDRSAGQIQETVAADGSRRYRSPSESSFFRMLSRRLLSPRRMSRLPRGHYSPPTTEIRLCSRHLSGNYRIHNHLSLRQSTRVSHPQPGLHIEHPYCTSVAPPLHLRCTSVGHTEVLRRCYGGVTEVLRLLAYPEAVRTSHIWAKSTQSKQPSQGAPPDPFCQRCGRLDQKVLKPRLGHLERLLCWHRRQTVSSGILPRNCPVIQGIVAFVNQP